MSKTAVTQPVQLSSTVFPTADDLLLWQSLSPDERRAYLDDELAEAKKGGVSDKSINDLWAEAERIAAAAKENAL